MNTKFRSEILRGRKSLGKIDIDGRIIIKSVLKKWDGNTWIRFIWFVEEFPSCCEHGNEPRGSMNGDKSP
jgi:hypothetical protein